MRICFDKRVIATLAVVALGVVVLAPRLLGTVGPVLLMAACPLSMVLMMRGMRDQRRDDPEVVELQAEAARLRAELAGRQHQA